MKKNLDLNRLGMVIRWDVLNNWTYNLGVIAGLAICFQLQTSSGFTELVALLQHPMNYMP